MQSRTEQKRAEFNLDSWIPLANLLRSVVVGLFFLCIFVSLPPQFKVCVCVCVCNNIRICFVFFFFWIEFSTNASYSFNKEHNVSFVRMQQKTMYVCMRVGWIKKKFLKKILLTILQRSLGCLFFRFGKTRAQNNNVLRFCRKEIIEEH